MDDGVREQDTRARRIAILATLDTKAGEADLVARAIRARGNIPVLVDLSIPAPGAIPADITRDDILTAAGEQPVPGEDRPAAMARVARGVAAILAERVATGDLHGVIGLGGGTGSWMAANATRELPLGFPKLIVTTFVHGDGATDTAILPTVADIAGVNRLLGPILVNAAGAISGMAEQPPVDFPAKRATIAMTMFGVTTAGGDVLRRTLEEAGCEVVVFHATGAGGLAMERLAREGRFDAIVDWTTSEVTDHLTGGICTSGPTRLDAAAELGLPQVVVPGAVDVINVHLPVPEKFEARVRHMHLPTVPLIRASVEENAEIGSWIADKLSRTTGPATVVIPRGGFSSLDIDGGEFWDPEATAAFESAVRAGLPASIPVVTSDRHINDPAFAREVADAVLALLPADQRETEQ
jgi:uncharacterized protein (UPF0261 family)